MGTSLLEVLRTVATDADARSAFEADPNSYLGQYGYGDVPVEDMAEAVELTADTLPPETAMEISPSDDGPGLIGVLQEHDGDGGPFPDDDPSEGLAFGDADFDGEPDGTSGPGDAMDDRETDGSEDADDGGDDTFGAATFGTDSGTPADPGVNEVDFGSGSFGDGPGLGDPAGGPVHEGTGFGDVDGFGDEPGFSDGTGFDGTGTGLLDQPMESMSPIEADDPSFDEAESFTTRLDNEPPDDPDADIDDIGSF